MAFVTIDRDTDQAAFGPVWLKDVRVARLVMEALLYGERERHYYVLRDIEDNPVTAGLVDRPEDWAWSSARPTGESACPTLALCPSRM